MLCHSALCPNIDSQREMTDDECSRIELADNAGATLQVMFQDGE